MGAAPDLSDASLQMMIYKTFSFRRIFYKKLNHIQVFEVVMNIKWKRKRYPLTASSFRFHENLPLPHSRFFYCSLILAPAEGRNVQNMVH